MKNNTSKSAGSFLMSGTPYEPVTGNDRHSPGLRIMPSQFLHPMSPVRYSLLRNIVPADEENTGRFFS